MKAWKRIHITKKRAACGVLGLLLLAAAYMGVPRAAEKVFAVAEGERRLPIYCVQTEKPQVSVSFDASSHDFQTNGWPAPRTKRRGRPIDLGRRKDQYDLGSSRMDAWYG